MGTRAGEIQLMYAQEKQARVEQMAMTLLASKESMAFTTSGAYLSTVGEHLKAVSRCASFTPSQPTRKTLAPEKKRLVRVRARSDSSQGKVQGFVHGSKNPFGPFVAAKCFFGRFLRDGKEDNGRWSVQRSRDSHQELSACSSPPRSPSTSRAYSSKCVCVHGMLSTTHPYPDKHRE